MGGAMMEPMGGRARAGQRMGRPVVVVSTAARL